MAVKIRLRRMGRRGRPIYGIVAADVRSPRDGRYIEDLGRYNPIPEPAEIEINEDRVLYWIREGATPTDTVKNILSSRGVLLRLHLERKGKTAEEIEAAVAEWRTNRLEGRKLKTTKADRDAIAMKTEIEEAAKAEAKAAALRAEAEAKARAEADAARAAVAAEREAAKAAAAAEALLQQTEANAATKAAEAPAEETPAVEDKSESADA